MPKITFQRQKCVGCGYCEEIAPLQWKMNLKDGRSNLINATKIKQIYYTFIDYDELDINVAAAKACPVNIIKIDEN